MAEGIQATVEELRLLNFRAFEAARLRLFDLTFLVGRNGAGKSSFLEAAALLREAVTDNLENALDRRGGLLKVRRLAAGKETTPSLGVAIVLALRLPGGRRARVMYGFLLSGASSDLSYAVRERLRLYPEGTSDFDRVGDLFSASRNIGVSPPPANLVLPLIARSDSLCLTDDGARQIRCRNQIRCRPYRRRIRQSNKVPPISAADSATVLSKPRRSRRQPE